MEKSCVTDDERVVLVNAGEAQLSGGVQSCWGPSPTVDYPIPAPAAARCVELLLASIEGAVESAAGLQAGPLADREQ